MKLNWGKWFWEFFLSLFGKLPDSSIQLPKEPSKKNRVSDHPEISRTSEKPISKEIPSSPSEENENWHYYTNGSEIVENPGLREETDTGNPVLADGIRFCCAAMGGKTKSQVIMESEAYFRKNPSDLAHIVMMYGKGGPLNGVSTSETRCWDDSWASAPYLSCEDGKKQIEEEYEDELQRIYKKFCDEGIL